MSKDWTGKKWNGKTRRDFVIDLERELEELLGENVEVFWNKRRKEIHTGTYYGLGRLNSVDCAVLLEAIYKARGKKWQRYYKAGYEPQFVDMMHEAIQEGGDK